MFKESLYSFFSIQVSRLEESLQDLNAFDNQESIHISRVCLKKIKTVLIFIEKLKTLGLSVKKILKKENELFDILGKMRELNKQYELLQASEVKLSLRFYEYQHYLNKQIENEMLILKKIDFCQIIYRLKSIQQNILEIIDMYDDAYLYDEAILYINSEFEEINIIKNNLYDYKDWHYMRKCLKNNMYMMTIILDSHYNSEITQEIINDIDYIQDSIGNWHDEIVSFELLTLFVEKSQAIKQNRLIDYKKLIRNIP